MVDDHIETVPAADAAHADIGKRDAGVADAENSVQWGCLPHVVERPGGIWRRGATQPLAGNSPQGRVAFRCDRELVFAVRPGTEFPCQSRVNGVHVLRHDVGVLLKRPRGNRIGDDGRGSRPPLPEGRDSHVDRRPRIGCLLSATKQTHDCPLPMSQHATNSGPFKPTTPGTSSPPVARNHSTHR